MVRGEGELKGAGEVEIVDGEDEDREGEVGGQRVGEDGHQGGFPCALDAIEAEEEGSGRGRGVLGVEGLDEGDAVGGLVVGEGGLFGHCAVESMFD